MAAIKGGKVFEDFTIVTEDFWRPGRPKTVDQLFDSIQFAIDQNADSIDILYHPEFGYPESIQIDYDFTAADEEWLFRMLENPRPLSDHIGDAKTKWRANEKRNYRYHLKFVTAWWQWEGDVEVVDGVAKAIGESGPNSDHIVRTVEEHLDFVRTANTAESDVAALFDRSNGSPIFISKDWTWTFIDGTGEHYYFTNFVFTD